MEKLGKHVLTLFIAGIAILLAVAYTQRDNVEQNTGPPNPAVSVYDYDSTTVTNYTGAIEVANTTGMYAETIPIIDNTVSSDTELTVGTYATKSEVNSWAQAQDTRPGASAQIVATRRSTSAGDNWSGMLRVTNDTGSRSVPVA